MWDSQRGVQRLQRYSTLCLTPLETSDLIEGELESTVSTLEEKVLELEEKLMALEEENISLKYYFYPLT